MSHDAFGQQSWEQRWEQALREHGDRIAMMPPNPLLVEVATALHPGLALDAGCGHGAEALWLATSGWTVTAVDFSVTALDRGRATAHALGADVAARVDWVEHDLARWVPSRGLYDLVTCLYVHVTGSVEQLVRRLGDGVAPGGTLLMVGHLPVDPPTGEPSPAAGQRQVTVPEATAALTSDDWELLVAEERPRRVVGTGVDAVIHAVRRR